MGSFPAILYVHWYEPESLSSHRSQFEEEARELAKSGAVCISIETLWSDRDFFLKRTQEEDAQNSIEEVVNIRRAMDLLLSQPNVDAKRFAYVGHDFGGMYGVLAGSLDQTSHTLCPDGRHASFSGLVPVFAKIGGRGPRSLYPYDVGN